MTKSVATVAVVSFCFASPIFAGSGGVKFSNEFLIAVEAVGAPETQPAVAPERGGPWQIRSLFATTQREQAAGRGREEAESAPQARQWLIASPTAEAALIQTSANAWDVAHLMLHDRAPREYNDLVRRLRERGAIRELEPSVTYYDARFAERTTSEQPLPEGCTPPSAAGLVALCGVPSAHWPRRDGFAWHHTATHLAPARASAASAFPYPNCRENVVTIAHLDTGYDKADDSASPPCFDKLASVSFLPNETGGGWDRFTGHNPGHGPGTLSILAGGRVKFSHPRYGAYDDFLGGAPFAHVFSYRVTDTVAVIWPKNIATAIERAVAEKADVISMSIGGAPSGALRDAVNDAYDNGTAMFFAGGDFIRLPIPFVRFQTPHTIVYPARFERTTAVVGITATDRSYGLDPGYGSLLRFSNMGSWMLRGSYGPERAMGSAIAAYTPNVARHHATKDGYRNAVDLDFAGTSAATPQVAAAAALWLQVHRAELAGEWRTWKKAEAVYQALRKSAYSGFPTYSREYFGVGVLRADAALHLTANEVMDATRTPSAKAKIGFNWVTTVAAVIGPDPRDNRPLDAATKTLHEQMLRTEVAQLVYSSVQLQSILDKSHGSDSVAPTTEGLEKFRAALLADSRTSEYLRRALQVKLQ